MGGPGWHCMRNNLIRNILPLTHSNVIIMVLCLSVPCVFFPSTRDAIRMVNSHGHMAMASLKTDNLQ